MLIVAPSLWESEDGSGGPPTWECAVQQSADGGLPGRSEEERRWQCSHFLLHARSAPSTSWGHLDGTTTSSENLKTSLKLRKGVKIGGSSELLPNHFLLETLARQTSSCCVCVWASKDPSSWQNPKFEPQSKPQDQSDWHCCLKTRFPPKHRE